jgi:hypothetical protein
MFDVGAQNVALFVGFSKHIGNTFQFGKACRSSNLVACIKGIFS